MKTFILNFTKFQPKFNILFIYECGTQTTVAVAVLVRTVGKPGGYNSITMEMGK